MGVIARNLGDIHNLAMPRFCKSRADALISRLDSVKRTGSGRWMVRCPSHADKHASLSVRELDDGRILLHCFAACDVGEVLGSIGMTVNDLFPERLPDGKPERRPFPAIDVLKAIAIEAQLVAIVACDVADGVLIEAATKDRIILAVNRINAGLNAAGLHHG